MRNIVLMLSVLAVSLVASAGGWVIVNEDNDGFFVPKRPNISTRDLDERIDELLSGGRVTHVFWCVNGCRPNYDSKVWEPIWAALEDPKTDYADTPRTWPENVKALFDQGIDPAKYWIEKTRQKGASPWVSMRMNDNHFIWVPHVVRVCRFNQEHPEWWVVPHYSGGQWEPYALDFARKEVRDHTFALVDEIVRRYDADGIELDFCRAVTYFNETNAVRCTPVMTAFIARCRAAAQAEAARRKRPYAVAIRLAHDPETARRRGFDAVEIARRGLVDAIIVCSDAADMGWDRSFEAWRRVLGEAAPRVRLVAGTTGGFSLSRRLHNPASLRAWADLQRDAGAKDLYIFNHQYMTKAARSAVCDGTAFVATPAVGPREFAVSQIIPPTGDLPPRRIIPANLAAKPSLPVHLPKDITARKSVEVVFGHKLETPFVGEVRLNGCASTGGEETEEDGVRLVRRVFPLSALKGGESEISFSGSGPDAVTWVSLRVDVRPSGP